MRLRGRLTELPRAVLPTLPRLQKALCYKGKQGDGVMDYEVGDFDYGWDFADTDVDDGEVDE